MKSVTSYFNPALIRKNLTRFWPLWAFYTLIWTYALPVRCIAQQRESWGSTESPSQRVMSFAQDIPDLLQFGLFLALVFGILTAMAMFSYLYNSRSACMIHALPVRREGLFLSSYLSGLISLLAPHLVIWLVTLGAEASGGYIDLYTITVWLLGQSGMCIFFYSFAAFCAMFTGHLLALPAFYGILNILAAGFLYLLVELLSSFLYGFAGVGTRLTSAVLWLTPVFKLGNDLRWTANFGGQLAGAGVIAVYTLAGLVLAALALLVYRRRHVESAGDVVAVSLVRPVFKYGVAVCSSLCFGYCLYSLLDLEGPVSLGISLMLWAAIGYFAAEMLLRKSFRVLKAWKGCAVLLVLVVLFVAGLSLDCFGFVSRVPALQQVQSVTISNLYSYPYDSAYAMQVTDCSDPSVISRVLDVHQAILDQHGMEEQPYYDDSNSFSVDYQLQDGSILSRRYRVSLAKDSALARAMEALISDPELVRQSYGFDDVPPDRISNVYLSCLWNIEKQAYTHCEFSELSLPDRDGAMRELYQAVLQDFEQGNLGLRYLFNDDPERLVNTYTGDLTFDWIMPSVTRPGSDGGKTTYARTGDLTVTLTPKASNTIRVLTRLGVLSDGVTLVPYGLSPSDMDLFPIPVD